MKKFNIGDIVFVPHYRYKNGNEGKNHSFVIIDEEEAIDVNYFGLLISSHTEKATFPYNEELNKNDINRLRENSIVKCDDLIEFSNSEIQFKIGQVSEADLEKFVNTYLKYLDDTIGANV